jgi:hypothetical protein
MKVVFQNPHTSDCRDFRHSLTLGGEYEVLGIEAGYYRLLNNKGEPILYDSACFDVVDQAEPVFWKSEVGDDGERYAYPPGWGVAGFFETWHDQNIIVRMLFDEQLAFWYPTARLVRKTS